MSPCLGRHIVMSFTTWVYCDILQNSIVQHAQTVFMAYTYAHAQRLPKQGEHVHKSLKTGQFWILRARRITYDLKRAKNPKFAEIY